MTATIATVLGVGRFTAAKVDSTLRPRITQAKPAVVYCHSAAMDGTEALGLAQLPSIGPLMRALATDRLVVAPTLETLWGNATSRARIDAAVAWARANGASAGPVVLIGASMGGCAALSWAAANPADTAGVVGIIPAVDLEAIRVSSGTLRPSIDAAYGVVYPAALPAGASPAGNNPGVPTQLWYATDDAVSENVPAYAATVGAELHGLGALGHSDAAVAAVPPASVAAFVLAHT